MDAIVRLPDPDKIDEFLRDRASVNKLKKAIGQAVAVLEPTNKAGVERDFNAHAGVTLAVFLNKGTDTGSAGWQEKRYLTWLITAIRSHDTDGLAIHPGFATARVATEAEMKLVRSLQDKIRIIVNEIVTQNRYDTHIANVFGAANVQDAKDRFAAGLQAMERLVNINAIHIDAIRKDKVWNCGGLTSESRIALPDGKLQQSENVLLTTLVHEMTHAMPPHLKTGDKYYRSSPEFTLARPERKLKTADYYAEVFDRILKKDPGTAYVPRDTADKSNEPDKVLALYKDKAVTLTTRAWVTAINIYGTLSRWGGYAETNQSHWLTYRKTEVNDAFKLNFAKNASRVLGLTIHKRAALELTKNEITQLDLSIMDNKLNVLARLLTDIGKVLTLPADVKDFEEVKVDHVLKHALVMRNHDRQAPGLLSKNIDKDIVVIRSLSELNDAPDWANYGKLLAAGLPHSMTQYGAANIH